jgi:hypothetical protein
VAGLDRIDYLLTLLHRVICFPQPHADTLFENRVSYRDHWPPNDGRWLSRCLAPGAVKRSPGKITAPGQPETALPSMIFGKGSSVAETNCPEPSKGKTKRKAARSFTRDFARN